MIIMLQNNVAGKFFPAINYGKIFTEVQNE